MNDEERLAAEEKMINDEFQALINDYLNSNHRRKVEIITKAFNVAKEAHKASVGVRENPILCIRWQLLVSFHAKWGLGLLPSRRHCCMMWWKIPIYGRRYRMMFGDKLPRL